MPMDDKNICNHPLKFLTCESTDVRDKTEDESRIGASRCHGLEHEQAVEQSKAATAKRHGQHKSREPLCSTGFPKCLVVRQSPIDGSCADEFRASEACRLRNELRPYTPANGLC